MQSLWIHVGDARGGNSAGQVVGVWVVSPREDTCVLDRLAEATLSGEPTSTPTTSEKRTGQEVTVTAVENCWSVQKSDLPVSSKVWPLIIGAENSCSRSLLRGGPRYQIQGTCRGKSSETMAPLPQPRPWLPLAQVRVIRAGATVFLFIAQRYEVPSTRCTQSCVQRQGRAKPCSLPGWTRSTLRALPPKNSLDP